MEFRRALDYDNVLVSKCGIFKLISGKLLKGHISIKGYKCLSVRVEGKLRTRKAHRLIWEAWVSKIPEGMQINHIDGNKLNNDLNNLEVVTQKENNIHAIKLGLRGAIGHENPNSKLSTLDVKNIRKSYVGKYGQIRSLAKQFNVTPEQISNIIHRKSWGHI